MPEYKCNLVIPGVAKSGTSSLHSYLDTHPEVCMSSIKEPHHFSIDAKWNKGATFHNALFNHCTKDASIFGESSTTYFIAEAALKRISSRLHAPKIIIVLREPVSRAISHYKWLYALGLENRSLLDAMRSGYDFDPNRSIDGNYMGYLEFSSYIKWVPKWQREFGSENVLLLDSKDLRHNTTESLDKCTRFLGVGSPNWSLPEEKNKTEEITMRSENAASKVAKSMLPKDLKNRLKALAPSLARKWNDAFVTRVKRPPPTIADQDLMEIRALLSDEHDYYCALLKTGA